MASTDPVAPGSKAKHFTWSIAPDTGIVTCTAVGLADKPVLTFDIASVHADLRKTLMGYGLKQFLSDRVANIASTSEKVEEMEVYYQNLRDGVWSDRGTGEGGARAPSLLMLAVARATGKTIERTQEVFAAKEAMLSPDDFKKWRKGLSDDPRTKAAAAKIQAEKAAKAAKKEGNVQADLSDFD